MTTADFAYAIEHDDVIAWHSTICQVNDCGPVEIPYRAILPKGVENLLCPGATCLLTALPSTGWT